MESGLSGLSFPHRPAASIEVAVPARLHLGFLDLEGGLGRRFGSIGLALDDVETRITAVPAEIVTASGPSAARADGFARQMLAVLGLAGGVGLTIAQAIPEHAGLGSGTQMALAVGTAIARLYHAEAGHADWGPRTIAKVLGRGARSGIGIGAFEQGGLLVDGGRLGGNGDPAPIISRVEFPSPWRILLVFDAQAEGLHGDAEAAAFRDLPDFAPALSAHLCRLVLMALLPAAAETDLGRFAAAVAEIQNAVGDFFAPFQGGRFASPAVAGVLDWLRAEGVEGVGQSSWGPTGFAFVENASAAGLLQSARRKWADDDRLRFMICRGRNQGGTVDMGFPMAAASDSRRR